MTKRLFFSYSHKDEALRDELETHLVMLKRQGFIEAWHDRRIPAGDHVDHTISAELDTADIILLLVSADFLASTYCYDVEVRRAMERHERGEARLIPVILRPCDWQPAPFGKLLAAPRDGRPITMWPNRDKAFLDVAKAIRQAIQERGGSAQQPSHAAARAVPAVSEPVIRSSNLRVAKRFTDQERDRFLHEAFDYIAKYFENSFAELEKRNRDIGTAFRRIDANRFTGAAYRDGKKINGCTVFLGNPISSICIGYISNDSGSTNSYQESLSVESDDQTIFLKSQGMANYFRNSNRDEKLTMEGGAELLWSMFMERLQSS